MTPAILAQLPQPCLLLDWRKADVKHPEYDESRYDWACDYWLVLPSATGDIRVSDCGAVLVRMGHTSVGGPGPLTENSDVLYLPFRDGVHIQWDAARLRLPAFVAFGKLVQAIEPMLPVDERTALSRREFMTLSLTERRKIMAEQVDAFLERLDAETQEEA